MAMASGAIFSGQNICTKAMVGLLTTSVTFKKTYQLEQNKVKTQTIKFTRKAAAKKKVFVISSKSSSNLGPSDPLSVSHTIMQFYICINEKNLKRLSGFISDDCCINDLSFTKQFEGKKEVMHFYNQLTASMGQNVKFNLGHICEGDDSTAGVEWHLEWKNTKIPFTRGCSFYECTKEGGKLMIKKAQVVIESPIKPGSLALALLKTVTSLFDDFPRVAEWFLESPHVILQWILKIYTFFFQSFINPILASYINLWKFMARLLSYALNTMVFIYKIFFK